MYSVYQASPWEGGMGGRGEGPGNEADTMEDCIDSALCGYGFMLKSSDFHNGDPLSRNSAISANIEFEIRDDFIRTGCFLTKLRLLHQGVTGGLHCIVLNYDIQLCYYKDTISLNSQAGQWNTVTCCYVQLKHVFSKRQSHKLPFCIQLSFYL